MTPEAYVEKIAAALGNPEAVRPLVAGLWREHLSNYNALSVDAAAEKWRPIVEAAKRRPNAEAILEAIGRFSGG